MRAQLVEWRIGVALLAAGASRRFGEADKLAADFHGLPLGAHAARAIPLDRFARAWLVADRGSPAWAPPGFEVLVNACAEEGMSLSVALAAKAAQAARLDALLIALADMPFVPSEHFQELAFAISDHGSSATSALGSTRMPPAIFGSAHFKSLSRLSGDRGARGLLAGATIVPCPPEWLVDIDTRQALQRYGQVRPGAPKPSPKGDT